MNISRVSFGVSRLLKPLSLSFSPSPAAPQESTGNSSNNISIIIVPTVLIVLLALALVIIAGLAVFVYKRRKSNRAASVALDNPTYVGADVLQDSKASDLHFDPRRNFGSDYYSTVTTEPVRYSKLSHPMLTNSKEDLLGDPPEYSTLSFVAT